MPIENGLIHMYPRPGNVAIDCYQLNRIRKAEILVNYVLL